MKPSSFNSKKANEAIKQLKEDNPRGYKFLCNYNITQSYDSFMSVLQLRYEEFKPSETVLNGVRVLFMNEIKKSKPFLNGQNYWSDCLNIGVIIVTCIINKGYEPIIRFFKPSSVNNEYVTNAFYKFYEGNMEGIMSENMFHEQHTEEDLIISQTKRFIKANKHLIQCQGDAPKIENFGSDHLDTLREIPQLWDYDRVIGFSGNREIIRSHWLSIRKDIRNLLKTEDPKTTAIINGGAKGFDFIATKEAIKKGFKVFTINPYGENGKYKDLKTEQIDYKYKTYGNARFHERNQVIAEVSNFVLIYNRNNGNGTKSTIRYCKENGTNHIVL